MIDGSQNETRTTVTKKTVVIQYLLHGAAETGLPRPGALRVGCLTWVGSVAQVRRCVGENDRTGSEKSTQKSCFKHFSDTFLPYLFSLFLKNFLRVARGETEGA